MTAPPLDPIAIMGAVLDHARRLGEVERVIGHEPKSDVGSGATLAGWIQRMDPVQRRSGLDQTSARLVINLRFFMNMLREPADEIDPDVLRAVDALMRAYSGDLDLGDAVSDIDVFGAHGIPMGAVAGYVNISGQHQRVMTLTLPLIINDLWTQVRQ